MSPLGSEVITTSASATACGAAVEDLRALVGGGVLQGGDRVEAAHGVPGGERLAAIGPPMWPSPKNAIVVI